MTRETRATQDMRQRFDAALEAYSEAILAWAAARLTDDDPEGKWEQAEAIADQLRAILNGALAGAEVLMGRIAELTAPTPSQEPR